LSTGEGGSYRRPRRFLSQQSRTHGGGPSASYGRRGRLDRR
jgi:hypothetical protein